MEKKPLLIKRSIVCCCSVLGWLKTVQIRVFWNFTVVDTHEAHELQFDTFLTCTKAFFDRINSTDISLINIGLLPLQVLAFFGWKMEAY